jgi:ATP-dependent DNA helicase DinG
VRSYDPDAEEPYVEPSEEGGIALDDDIVQIDEDRALELLDKITEDLPGGGERREGQRDMVRAVAAGISRKRHTVVEAGTGVGKSLAYLVPAALSKRRVVIATATKNLQDQLAGKDAPTVAEHVTPLKVAVLKGRANYLCRLKAQEVGAPTQMSFDAGDDVPATVVDQVRRILDWSNTTSNGDRDELSFEVDGRAWRTLSVSPQECLGRVQCPQGQSCFAELAKDQAASSDIVIVNSHLYGAHLASGSTILPAHDIVVFDEAHEVVNIFSQLLGTSLNANRFRALATMARSVLGAEHANLCTDLTQFADRFERALEEQFDSNELKGLSEQVNALLAEGTHLTIQVTELLRATETGSQTDEIRRIRTQGPAVHLTNDLARLGAVSDDELTWLNRRDREIDIELSLIDIGPRLRDELWPSVTGILTSATIPETLVESLGLGGISDELQVASPFNYAENSLLYVPEHLPARTSDDAEEAIALELIDLIVAAGGRTLALFTNRTVMKRVADEVSQGVDTPILVQDTLSRKRLIERFRDEESASLFAVTSYWQGIDVPGTSLSLVTIDRLPFRRPDDPLSVARRDRAGDQAFSKVDLPHATMLLAQGVGRLIRSETDRGVVAVLDTRLATANYRGRMLKKLPPMRRTRNKEEVLAFLRSIAN